MLKKLNYEYITLIAIIALAIILRFWSLSTIPVGFNDDEAAFGYNAYSILKTGQDEWGKLLPFPTFESFGDWKLVGYLYVVVISQFFFGVTEFATRFPSALIGVCAVLATYLLTKKLFNRNVALVSAFFLAISPWHIAASRNAFESDILIFFITFGTYLFIKGLNKPKLMTASLAFFGISFYIYRSAWLFTPLFLISLFLIFKKDFNRSKDALIKGIIVIFIFLIPLAPSLWSFKGQSRFFQESFIFGIQNKGIADDVNQRRGYCTEKITPLVCKVTYNKFFFFIPTYLNNLIGNISPSTYFVNGNPNGYQSFSPRGYFFTFELPLILVGIYFLLKGKNKGKLLLGSWFILALIAPSTTGVGNPGRLNIIMPVPQIVAGFGFVSLISILKSKMQQRAAFLFFGLIIAMSLIRFAVDTTTYYPKFTSRDQRYGYKELFQKINQKCLELPINCYF